MNESSISVVLIPGFMLDESLWDEVSQKLPNHWRIYKASLENGKTIEEMAKNIIKHLPDKFLVIGFSLGGYVARALVHQFPHRVFALILISSSSRLDTDTQKKSKLVSVNSSSHKNFKGLSTKVIAQSLHPSQIDNHDLIERIQNMGKKLGYNTFVNQSQLDRNVQQISKIQCPTLILWGAQDIIRSQQEALEQRDLALHSHFVTIEDTGHMIPIEQPQHLVDSILNWLTTINLNA